LKDGKQKRFARQMRLPRQKIPAVMPATLLKKAL
jgi:hypothetical protein